ncbi:hypothetical protein BKA67DRAFT_332182 [Truncatella angustata]|uniref:Uncharacterized protein n=1 Tax=Truncatella angustata TaxID=152316 RepID=A0A9P8UG12_9PEZI|nr:uncharacterized protein BKA67DRAFT_332182 [Truncatella angustata]KAH6651592.1 hypothetical protein BKA67DRAFT_332182 [Truncatella angustata]KAH8195793.1 hypothetical protein TruAng_010036 [Truncatella angustata]
MQLSHLLAVALATTGGLGFNLNRTATAETKRGVIPVSHKGCYATSVDPDETKTAGEKFKEWTEGGSKVGRENFHAEYENGSAMFVCNCAPVGIAVPAHEIDDALQQIQAHCGRSRGGWLWAHDWNKGFNLADAARVTYPTLIRSVCPCGYGIGDR